MPKCPRFSTVTAHRQDRSIAEDREGEPCRCYPFARLNLGSQPADVQRSCTGSVGGRMPGTLWQAKSSSSSATVARFRSRKSQRRFVLLDLCFLDGWKPHTWKISPCQPTLSPRVATEMLSRTAEAFWPAGDIGVVAEHRWSGHAVS